MLIHWREWDSWQCLFWRHLASFSPLLRAAHVQNRSGSWQRSGAGTSYISAPSERCSSATWIEMEGELLRDNILNFSKRSRWACTPTCCVSITTDQYLGAYCSHLNPRFPVKAEARCKRGFVRCEVVSRPMLINKSPMSIFPLLVFISVQ